MPDHRACIDALAQRVGSQLPPERLLVVFETAFNAIWRRTQTTLGEVTLTAIVNRVLYVATERYPALAALKVSSSGIDCRALNQQLSSLEREALERALYEVLVDLLTVIGNLTAEILTPALHEALFEVESADCDITPEGSIARKHPDEL